MFIPLHSVFAPLKHLAAAIVLAAVVLPLSSCTWIGLAAHSLPNGLEAASYKGLAGQTVGVMVWADRGIIIDHSTVEIDLSRRIQTNLQEAQAAKIDEVQGVTWVKPEVVARFQQDHPELEGEEIEKVAPQMPTLTRLIYIEITTLSLHPSEAVELSRGAIKANVKVYEVKGDSVVCKYSANDLSVEYPENCPPEGVTGLDDDEVYKESMNLMGNEIAKRFVTHEADAE